MSNLIDCRLYVERLRGLGMSVPLAGRIAAWVARSVIGGSHSEPQPHLRPTGRGGASQLKAGHQERGRSERVVRHRLLTRHLAVLAAVLIGLPALTLGATVGSASGTGFHHVVTLYHGVSDPGDIVAGPDGALWFTNDGGNSIGRVTTAGVVHTHGGHGINFPRGIAVRIPSGALWFTNPYTSGSIGRITTTGKVTMYTGPGISAPQYIAAGPDGALWFTNDANNSIGRITTSGVVTNYTGPGISSPLGIVAGPNGGLWFTNSGNNSIGRITTAGVVTNYTGPGISSPLGIVAGPNGAALWFTNDGNNSIGRITTAGVVTNYTGPGISSPTGIAAGPDGRLWFNNNGNNSTGRITTSGGEHQLHRFRPFLPARDRGWA